MRWILVFCFSHFPSSFFHFFLLFVSSYGYSFLISSRRAFIILFAYSSITKKKKEIEKTGKKNASAVEAPKTKRRKSRGKIINFHISHFENICVHLILLALTFFLCYVYIAYACRRMYECVVLFCGKNK